MPEIVEIRKVNTTIKLGYPKLRGKGDCYAVTQAPA